MSDLSDFFDAMKRLGDVNDVIVGVQSLKRSETELLLQLQVNFLGEELAQEHWRIACAGVVDWRFSIDCWGTPQLIDDHSLLKLWREPLVDIYFSAAPASPAAVVGELTQIVDKEFGDWLMNGELLPVNLFDRIAGGYGMLCTGPRSTMTLLESVLVEHRMNPSIRPASGAWKHGMQPSGPHPSVRLLVIEKCYVVAETFQADLVCYNTFMSRVRCHFDGKVFVPEEPVNAVTGATAEVTLAEGSLTNGTLGTMADLLAADASGWIDQLHDRDTLQYAEELRRRSNMPNYDKQRAFVDLHEYWDIVGRNRSDEDDAGGTS